MEVPRDQFASQAIKIIQEIAESHFVAIDFEFSGIAGRRAAGRGKFTLQEFYEDTKASAEKYQILQVGIAIVKEDLKNSRYVVRPYNFNLSPLPALRERTFIREWSSTSGSMSFLTDHGFNHSLPFTEGIHYLSRKEESDIRKRRVEEEDNSFQYADIETKPSDKIVINHIRASVQNWLAQPADQRQDYINVPGEVPGIPATFNRFQIRLTHQVVRKEFPGLQTQGMGHFVRITSPTEEQQTSIRQRLNEERERMLNDAIGFRWIMEAIFGGNITNIPSQIITAGLPNVALKGKSPMDFVAGLQHKLRQRSKVLVGHNCFGDLVFMYRTFIGTLPLLVEDFTTEMNMLCPAIIDTKHLASFADRWGDTSLAHTESCMQQQKTPLITVPSEYNRYVRCSSHHEAGYDALLTANIMIRLSAKMEREAAYTESVESSSGESNQSQSVFGVEDGYVTPKQSTVDQKDEHKNVKSLLDVVKSPVAAVTHFFDKNIVEGSKAVAGKSRKQMVGRNIFEVLENEEETAMPSDKVDLMTFSDTSEDGSRKKGRNLQIMVKQGDMMPRWDGATGFWKHFGNKLQTNATRGGICDLER